MRRGGEPEEGGYWRWGEVGGWGKSGLLQRATMLCCAAGAGTCPAACAPARLSCSQLVCEFVSPGNAQPRFARPQRQPKGRPLYPSPPHHPTQISTSALSLLPAAQRLDAVDSATPAGISRTDAFRVAVEALTIDGAVGKMFSLCPADKQQTNAVFKEMRFAGVDRRQEVVALLTGGVDSRVSEIEAAEAKAKQAAEEAAKAKEGKLQDFEAMPASSQEEIDAAFARTRARAKFVAEEEAAKLAAIEEKRAERAKTQSMIEARIAEVAKAKAGGGGMAMSDDDDPRGPQKPKAKSDDGDGGKGGEGAGGAGGKPEGGDGGGDGGDGGKGGDGGEGGDGPVATV